MLFPPIKTILGMLAFLLILINASTVPIPVAANSLAERAMDTTGIDTTGLCYLQTILNRCLFSTATNYRATTTRLLLFDHNCVLTGYNPGIALEEKFGFASELPMYVVVTVEDNGWKPYFWYNSQQYKNPQCWTDDDGGVRCTAWFWC